MAGAAGGNVISQTFDSIVNVLICVPLKKRIARDWRETKTKLVWKRISFSTIFFNVLLIIITISFDAHVTLICFLHHTRCLAMAVLSHFSLALGSLCYIFLLWLTADFYGLPMELVLKLTLFMHISWNKPELYQTRIWVSPTKRLNIQENNSHWNRCKNVHFQIPVFFTSWSWME